MPLKCPQLQEERLKDLIDRSGVELAKYELGHFKELSAAHHPHIAGRYMKFFMMMSPNGNIFRVTGPLSGEFTGHK